MSWAESWRLFKELAIDPSSHIGAALGGYDYPLSREAAILADTFDLVIQINRDPKKPKPKPYPRPWPEDVDTRHVGKTNLTPDEAPGVLSAQFGKTTRGGGKAKRAPAPVPPLPPFYGGQAGIF